MTTKTRIICLFGLPHWPNEEGAKESFVESLRLQFAGEPVEVSLYDDYDEFEKMIPRLRAEERKVIFVIDQFLRMGKDDLMLQIPANRFLGFLRQIQMEGVDVNPEPRLPDSPCDLYSVMARPAAEVRAFA